MAQHHHRTELCDLPDSCLLHILKNLSPLPDKFSVGACCWRFYRLVSDRRLWLVVSPTGAAPESAPGGAGPVYTTLKAAVQASRPGDTIWLSPGVTHSAADVDIPWPLHLLGGGALPSDTWLSAPLTADCALSFTASGKVAHLSMASTLAPCVVHRRGSLTLQRCLLAAEPQGLHHLVSPVVTLAAGSAATVVAAAAAAASGGGSSSSSSSSSAAVDPATDGSAAICAAANVGVEEQPGCAATAHHSAAQQRAASPQQRCTHTAAPEVAIPPTPILTAPSLCGSSAGGSSSSAGGRGAGGVVGASPPQPGVVGPGRLQVVECQLMGGSTAVRCSGTGQVRNVRAIYETHSQAPYLWLDVDSADGPAPAAAAAAAASAAVPVLAGSAAAGWAARAAGAEAVDNSLWQAAGAEHEHHQQQQQQAPTAAATSQGGPDASTLLQQRSKAWQQRQAAMPAGLDGLPGCPGSTGLARIQAVLGGRSINPANLAAHLTAKQQQQQQQQQQQR